MTSIQCLVCCGIECFKYHLIYSTFWKKRMKRIWISFLVAGVIFSFVISKCLVRDSAKMLVALFIAMLVSFASMDEKVKDRIIKCLEIVLINLVVDSLCGVSTDWIIGNNILDMSDFKYSLCISGEAIGLYVCLMCLHKCGLGRRLFRFRGKKIAFITFLIIFNGVFSVALLNHMKTYFQESSIMRDIDLLVIVLYLSIGIVAVLVIELRKKNVKIFKMLMLEKKQKEMQEFYYEELLSKEEATRRYRHDMANHILCIESMLKRADIEATRKYIGDMEHVVLWEVNNCYTTGHRIIDIVTNYQLSRLDSSIKQNVFGKIKYDTALADMDLSVLYSNLLQNAVEDLLKEGEDKFIEIYFEQGMEYCEIKIINSLSNESKNKADILVSEKTDSKNHGFGLKNVEGVIKKYNGTIKFLKEEDLFKVTVLLPNKRTA